MKFIATSSVLAALSCTSIVAAIFPSAQNAQRTGLPLVAPETNKHNARAPLPSFTLNFSGVQGNTATTRTSSGVDSSGTPASSEQNSASTTSNAQHTKAKSSKNFTTTIDPRLPAGGLQMILPAATAAPSYYKISDNVTFAWNYTSLIVTPTAVDILATCTKNSQMYTIALNQSISASTQAVTWDTNAYQSSAAVPLLTEDYTLIVHDSSQDVTAVASAGYLATFENFKFGMYIPQPYTPLADWHCATCNAAMSHLERQTLTFVCGMAAICVLSFGWFGGVAGIW